MKFYRHSRANRILRTAVYLAAVVWGFYELIHERKFLAAFVIIALSAEMYSLWNQYWEIAADGRLHSRGYGFHLMYSLSDLLYAGPIRENPGYPYSTKNALEIQIAGHRAKRYARVADRQAFVQQLQKSAPQAEIIPV